MMPLPLPWDGGCRVGSPAACATGVKPRASERRDKVMAQRLDLRWHTRIFIGVDLTSGEEEVAQHDVHRCEPHDDEKELALGDLSVGPAAVGASHGPYAPEEEHGEDETEEERCAIGRLKTARGEERSLFVGAHGEGFPSRYSPLKTAGSRGWARGGVK